MLILWFQTFQAVFVNMWFTRGIFFNRFIKLKFRYSLKDVVASSSEDLIFIIKEVFIESQMICRGLFLSKANWAGLAANHAGQCKQCKEDPLPM